MTVLNRHGVTTRHWMLVNFNSVCIGSIGSWRERCVVAVLFVAALSLFVFAELCATKQLWSKKRRS